MSALEMDPNLYLRPHVALSKFLNIIVLAAQLFKNLYFVRSTQLSLSTLRLRGKVRTRIE